MMLPSGGWATVVGSVAAACTTGAFVPQVVRVWRLRSAAEISLATFSVFAFGTLAWLIFGLMLGSLPIILANGITFGLAVGIVALKLRFDRRPETGSAGGPPRGASTGEVAPARPPR